jgi:hypothetical protein
MENVNVTGLVITVALIGAIVGAIALGADTEMVWALIGALVGQELPTPLRGKS